MHIPQLFYGHNCYLSYNSKNKIAIYRLACIISIYGEILNRNPCIVIRNVSPDSCQYTALFHEACEGVILPMLHPGAGWNSVVSDAADQAISTY